MSLKDKIEGDLKEALKSKDEFKVGALRFILSSVQMKEIDKRGRGGDEKLSDEELMEVLQKEAKKRKESFEIYEKSGRNDLAVKEKCELDIIKGYLPPLMSDEDVEKVIEGVIAEMKPSGPKDFGRVMGEVMKRTKGSADASTVSRMVKDKIPQ